MREFGRGSATGSRSETDFRPYCSAVSLLTVSVSLSSASLTTENLTDALAHVQVDKEDPVTVAEDFLEENGLL